MKSEQINELAAALSKAQGAMESARFDKQNPHYRSSYASLASVTKTIKGPLAANGLSYSQTTAVRDGALILVTTIMHSSGQWVAGEYPLPLNAKPQELGSALTYARRYGLSAAVGLAADEDDDAEATRKSNGNGAAINDLQAEELRQLAVKKKIDVSKLLELTHSESISDIPASYFARAKAWLEKHP